MRSFCFVLKLVVLFIAFQYCLSAKADTVEPPDANIDIVKDVAPSPALSGETVRATLAVYFTDPVTGAEIEPPSGTTYIWAVTQVHQEWTGQDLPTNLFGCNPQTQRSTVVSGHLADVGKYTVHVRVTVQNTTAWNPVYTTADVDLTVWISHLRLKSLTFSGSGYHTVETDAINPVAYSGQHWLDANFNGTASDINVGDRRFPVCFEQNTSMILSAQFQGPLSDDGGTYFVQGYGIDGTVWSAYLQWDTSTNRFKVDNMSPSNSLAQGIKSFNPYIIKWYIIRMDDIDYQLAGTSDNRVYVTRSAPLMAAPLDHLYESVVDISCRNGQGATSMNQEDIVAAIWSDFALKDPNVGVQKKIIDGYNVKDGAYMKYYLPVPIQPIPTVLNKMLAANNARCGGWAKMFDATLKVQGITNVVEMQCLPVGSPPPPDNKQFILLVKPWNYDRHIRKGPNNVRDSSVAVGSDDHLVTGSLGPLYASLAITPGGDGTLQSTTTADDIYTNGVFTGQPPAGTFVYLTYSGVRGGDSTELYGLTQGDIAFGLKAIPASSLKKVIQNGATPVTPGQGQGNPFPPSYFLDHAVVRFIYTPSGSSSAVTRIYDPSYGTGPYDSEANHEAASFIGIGRTVYTDQAQYGVHIKSGNGDRIIDYSVLP